MSDFDPGELLLIPEAVSWKQNPCPRCGSTEVGVELEYAKDVGVSYTAYCQNAGCEASTAPYATHAAAVTAWNRGEPMSDKVTFEATLNSVLVALLAKRTQFDFGDFVPDVSVNDMCQQRVRVTLEPLEPELLDCPFCGHGAVLKQYKAADGEWHYLVECSACTAAGEYMPNRSAAIAAWNRRA